MNPTQRRSTLLPQLTKLIPLTKLALALALFLGATTQAAQAGLLPHDQARPSSSSPAPDLAQMDLSQINLDQIPEFGQIPAAQATPTPTPAAGQTPTRQTLEVISFQPADGAASIMSDTIITIFFNRPVVVLNAIGNAPAGQAGQLPNPLTFAPPVAGVGEWLNTTTFQFTPGSAGFRRATQYTVRVEAGLTDALGEAVLAEAVTWRFTTIVPTATPIPTPTPTPARYSRMPSSKDSKPGIASWLNSLKHWNELNGIKPKFWPVVKVNL